MKALKTGFAKWVGALAIATLAPLAQAIPVGNFTGAGLTLGTVDGGNNLVIEVSGLVTGRLYDFKYAVEYSSNTLSPVDLSVTLGDFLGDASGLGGEFEASDVTEVWKFVLNAFFDPADPDNSPFANVSGATITCKVTTADPCTPSTTNVPEPGTLMLVGAAMLAGAATRRRKPV